MDFNGRLQDLDLDVNPYDFLEIPRGCRDLKQIKRAYQKKSLLLHPDRRRGNEYNFSTLHKCYVYLKTLCQELHATGDAYQNDLESRMRSIQQVRLNAEQRYHRERSDPRLDERRDPSRNLDFTQQLRCDNAIISDDAFDAQRVYEDMMQIRPESTTYHNLETPRVVNPLKGKKFNIDQFNDLFQETVGNIPADVPDLDGFTDFDELTGAASIVSDGRFMFVQGHVPSGNPDLGGGRITAPVPQFGLIEEFPEYDRQMEKERFAGKNFEGQVSEADLKNYKHMWNSSGDASNKKKLEGGQFKDRMAYMENSHVEFLEKQKRANREIVEAQIARLTDTTRAKLQDNLRITGCTRTLKENKGEDLPTKFAFPR